MKNNSLLVMKPSFFLITLCMVGLISVFGAIMLPLVCVIIFIWSILHISKQQNQGRVE